MAKLTAKQLEALTSADDGRILREDGGLVARVRAGVRGVTVQFRYEFKQDGLKRDQSLGSWPKKSLARIRAERDEVRATAAKGIDPTAARKAAKIEAQAAVAATIAEAERQAAENKTVADLFDEWIRDGVSRQDGNAELIRSFKKDVLPLIGKKPLRNLTEKDLLAVLRSVKARGLNRTVVIRNNDIGQMLRWGEKRKPWRGLMTDGNPADLRTLRQAYPDARIVVLITDLTVRTLREALDAGAAGFLMNDVAPDALIQSLELVMLGEKVFPTSLFPLLLSDKESPVKNAARRLMTQREEQILEFLITGASNKVIGHQLGISEDTVKVHLKALQRKIGATNRTQAAIWAANNGFNTSAGDSPARASQKIYD